jgi:YegS/Rv2252/BmrU family lipid kinase
MSRRALLIINRHARQGQQQAETAVAQLQSLGLTLIEQEPGSPEHLTATIHHYQDQVDLVIIGGGDGTLNLATTALVETQLPLGILPLGTANDLARTLGISTNLVEACQIIAAGKIQAIDLGWVNGQYFFNVASLGLSVQITRSLTKDIKRRWGVLAYAVTALKVLFRSRPFRAEIRWNEQPLNEQFTGEQLTGEQSTTLQSTKVKVVQIAVGNGRYYGGGMAVAADAAIDDQRLDLYTLEINHGWQILALLPALRRGQHTATAWANAWQGQEFFVYTRRPRPINTDGEITTCTPAHFRVMPHALQVLVP